MKNVNILSKIDVVSIFDQIIPHFNIDINNLNSIYDSLINNYNQTCKKCIN